MPDRYRLYAAECSLFSGKARAYLRHKQVAFDEVLATARAYREVIVPRTGKAMVPVLVSPGGVVVQDTTDIIDFVEHHRPKRGVYPPTPMQRLVALLLEVYADEWLVMPAMHYRWQFKRENLRFILGEFGATAAPGWPRLLQPLAGLPPALVFGGAYKRVFGIDRHNEPVIEAWTERLFGHLDAHFAQHDYLLGGRPSVGDFGLMGPMYAHLYRDPYSGAWMKRIAPNLARWVERMNRAPDALGDWLSDDTVPRSLDPILELMFDQQVPVLRDTVARVDTWVRENPGRVVPRFIGRHAYRMGGVTATRRVMPYAQWMWQRPALYWSTQSGPIRERIAQRFARIGGWTALDEPIPTVLSRADNRLVVAAAPDRGRTGHPSGAPAQPHALREP